MPAPAVTQVLVPSALRSSSSTSNTIIIPGRFTSAMVLLDVTAVTAGTTLDVWIQRGLKTAGGSDIEQAFATGSIVWDDFGHFTQVTTGTGQWLGGIVGGGNFFNIKRDASLAAATWVNGPIGDLWRCKWVMVGTNYTFSVEAQFIP